MTGFCGPGRDGSALYGIGGKERWSPLWEKFCMVVSNSVVLNSGKLHKFQDKNGIVKEV